MTIQRLDLGFIHGKVGGTCFQGHELVGTPKGLGAAAATFVGQSVINTGTIVFPGTEAAGDLALIVVNNSTTNTPDISGSGWTKGVVEEWNNPNNYFRRFYWKVLAAGDISSPPTLSNFGSFAQAAIQVFRGGTTVTRKATLEDDAGTAISLTGFTKDAASKFVTSFCYDRDGANTLGYPSGFAGVQLAASANVFVMGAAYVASSGYTNNASVDWTSGAAASFGNGAELFEIT